MTLTEIRSQDAAPPRPAAAMPPVLQMQNLGRLYGAAWAVRDVTLDLSPGVLGLLGPNGAGKSTLLNMLASVIPPSEGRIAYRGREVKGQLTRYRGDLGFAPQAVQLPPKARCRDVLLYIAALKGIARGTASAQIDSLAATLNLTAQMGQPVEALSGGMRRRLNVIQALLGDPSVILLDEPTAELDALEKLALQRLIADLSHRAVIIVSTHIVTDVEAVAERVAILSKGRLVADAGPQALAAGLAGQVWSCTVPADQAPAMAARHLVTGQRRTAAGVELRIVGTATPPDGAQGETPTLEDAYLAVAMADRAKQGA